MALKLQVVFKKYIFSFYTICKVTVTILEYLFYRKILGKVGYFYNIRHYYITSHVLRRNKFTFCGDGGFVL